MRHSFSILTLRIRIDTAVSFCCLASSRVGRPSMACLILIFVPSDFPDHDCQQPQLRYRCIFEVAAFIVDLVTVV